MAEFYKSKYTGEEIESLLEKINSQNIKFKKDELGNIIGIEINDESHQYVNISIQTDGGDSYVKSITIDGAIYDIEPIPQITINTKGDRSYIESITINGDTYEIEPLPDIPTSIEANPTGEATENLTTIKIGDVTYSIPEGTVVEGNPVGDATLELTKLKIGDTIYSIPQTGGGMYRYQLQVTLDSTSRTFYFESPYILESVDDILNHYKATTGRSTIAVYGNGGGFSQNNAVFLGYIQISSTLVGFYYFNIKRVSINDVYYHDVDWSGSSNINSYSPIITRLN